MSIQAGNQPILCHHADPIIYAGQELVLFQHNAVESQYPYMLGIITFPVCCQYPRIRNWNFSNVTPLNPNIHTWWGIITFPINAHILGTGPFPMWYPRIPISTYMISSNVLCLIPNIPTSWVSVNPNVLMLGIISFRMCCYPISMTVNAYWDLVVSNLNSNIFLSNHNNNMLEISPLPMYIWIVMHAGSFNPNTQLKQH